MKKAISIFCFALAINFAFAQDLKSKKEEPILPEQGDWAISIDAAPIFTYFGCFLSNGGAVAPIADYLTNHPFTISGKMFKDATTAFRANLRIGMNSTNTLGSVNDATVTTPPDFPGTFPQKEDSYKKSKTNIVLGIGIEKRRGKTRIQGFYGGEFRFGMINGVKETYKYGNALNTTTAVDASTCSTNFGGMEVLPNNNIIGAKRVLEAKRGASLTFGLRGFIGAEYFIMPKFSFGFEYSWGFMMTTVGKGSYSLESVGGTTPTVGTEKFDLVGGGDMTIDNDISGAAITATFHF